MQMGSSLRLLETWGFVLPPAICISHIPNLYDESGWRNLYGCPGVLQQKQTNCLDVLSLHFSLASNLTQDLHWALEDLPMSKFWQRGGKSRLSQQLLYLYVRLQSSVPPNTVKQEWLQPSIPISHSGEQHDDNSFQSTGLQHRCSQGMVYTHLIFPICCRWGYLCGQTSSS